MTDAAPVPDAAPGRAAHADGLVLRGRRADRRRAVDVADQRARARDRGRLRRRRRARRGEHPAAARRARRPARPVARDTCCRSLLLLPIVAARERDRQRREGAAPGARRAADRASRRSRSSRPTRASRCSRPLVVVVGLVPVVEEWFFRGVIQQGLVASAGVRGGIFLTALLFAIGHGGAGVSPQAWAALVAQTLAARSRARLRCATRPDRSCAPILLHVGVNGLGVLALALPARDRDPRLQRAGRAHAARVCSCRACSRSRSAIWLLSRETPEPVPPLPMTTDPNRDD